jgi:hypothetical protein
VDGHFVLRVPVPSDLDAKRRTKTDRVIWKPKIDVGGQLGDQKLIRESNLEAQSRGGQALCFESVWIDLDAKRNPKTHPGRQFGREKSTWDANLEAKS